MSELDLRTAAASAAPARRARPSAGEILAIGFVLFLLIATVAPNALSSIDPNAIAAREAFQGPSLQHWFGTDESGRDIYSRVVAGTSTSLLIGVSATAIGLALGLVLGVLAGFGGRVLDFTVNRTIEVLFAFPGLLLALLVIVIAGPGPVTATLAVGLSTAPGYARIIRGQLVGIRSSAYVESARVLGHGPWRILTRHILPNALAPLLVLATLGIGQAVVWAAALSYLGLGAQPPAAEWGAMLSAGRTYIGTAWWLTVFPGLMIVLTTIATTVLGRSLTRRSAGQR
ncbi:ABC transporter permease [Mycetocola sp.]|jgi:peptide/nickel transport system permease protein|uniref:ABC transporter permease n=1 Tax=Mycetocola sp. TaxID=1871042 RepID=UPI00263823FE|nr:ABC transporter permease [Mycetocola sp.]MCU1419406.1 peptide transporter permease [Mycetocola sp.]MCU1560430.1 peptide transporter permease [Mycetocola sp.]